MKITKKWVEGKDLIVRFATAGDVLGHRGFGGDMKYPVSAIAMEASRVCFIDNDFLATSLKANPSLTYAMMQIYARDLQHAEKRMSDLVLREVVERIVLALTEIAGKLGVGSDGFIALPVSRQDIASFAGTSYETVFKFFTRLSHDNIITTVGKKVKINDPVALNAFLSGHRQQS
jgi:CRP/FNR family transcriptional regulator